MPISRTINNLATKLIIMPSLAEAQANFIRTINDGPDALDPTIFDGDAGRVLLGLKAHANTVSHARLIALEETFPRSREALGHDIFNQLSRAYCDTAEARACDNNQLGEPFLSFLERHNVAPASIDLARIEWLWLESYNAADAEILELSDLAKLSEDQLLQLPILLHPASRLLELTAPLSDQLAEMADYKNAYAILITRPETTPAFTAASELQAQLFKETKKNSTIGNLLELVVELAGNTEPLAPIIELINAGAFYVLQGDHK